MRSNEAKEFARFLEDICIKFMYIRKMTPGSVALDIRISDEIYIKTCQSVDEYRRYEEGTIRLSGAKVAAILCFWIKKLKPYRIEIDTCGSLLYSQVNELCSLMAAGYSLKWGEGKYPTYSLDHLKSLLANLRYESTSIPSLIALFQAKTSNS